MLAMTDAIIAHNVVKRSILQLNLARSLDKAFTM